MVRKDLHESYSGLWKAEESSLGNGSFYRRLLGSYSPSRFMKVGSLRVSLWPVLNFMGRRPSRELDHSLVPESSLTRAFLRPFVSFTSRKSLPYTPLDPNLRMGVCGWVLRSVKLPKTRGTLRELPSFTSITPAHFRDAPPRPMVHSTALQRRFEKPTGAKISRFTFFLTFKLLGSYIRLVILGISSTDWSTARPKVRPEHFKILCLWNLFTGTIYGPSLFPWVVDIIHRKSNREKFSKSKNELWASSISRGFIYGP